LLKLIVAEVAHLRVQDGQESPDHGEDPGHVPAVGDVPDVAQVDVGVLAGQVAQVFHQRVLGLQVVVQPEDPAWVVLGDEGEVLLDPLEVLPLLAVLGLGVAVEGEANDLRETSSRTALLSDKSALQSQCSQ
jgi:hypothetical protein